MFNDLNLTCRDCGNKFLFSAGEQEFYANRGLTNKPKRCANCRVVLRIQKDGGQSTAIGEESCADCGCKTKVPFQPRGHKPVYCVHCFFKRKQEHAQERAQEPVAAVVG